MTPWGAAPPAKADFGIDDLFNLIDPSLLGAAGSAAAVPADASTLADSFQQDFWLPLHTALEDWINSPLGAEVDNNVINPLFSPITQFFDHAFAPGTEGFCGIICDGTPGTAADPNGGDGGLWFGNGGAGYSYDDTLAADAKLVGGDGGSAGGWGDGGDGGHGGFAAAGGIGGAGGEGFGNGGTGGDGGDGGLISTMNGLLEGPPGDGGAGGSTGNNQDWLGYFAAGNGGPGGMGGNAYSIDAAAGGPGGDGPNFLGSAGSGGPGGGIYDEDGVVYLLGSPGSAPTGEIGGLGGAGARLDSDSE